MLIVNGLEKLDPNIVKAMDIDGLQKILEFCRELDEIKDLGNTVNISNIMADSGLQFDLDNGKILKRINLHPINNCILVSIHEGIHCNQYTFEAGSKKPRDKDSFYKKNETIVRNELVDGYQEYKMSHREVPVFITITLKSDNYDKDGLIRYLLEGKDDLDSLKELLPKDDLTIDYIGPHERELIVYKDNQLISDEKGEQYGKER